jgi:hypothetical protein
MNISDLHRRVLASVSPKLLLDEFPNAAAAYSLRLLRTAYTGNCIEVRRSSDNALQNIGFVNGLMDTASLLSFVGAGNGFVRTWYDQSGNGRNATNTTNAQQPKVVNNGVIILDNLKPVINNLENNTLRYTPNIYQGNSKGFIFSVSKSSKTTYANLINIAFENQSGANHWIAKSRLTNQRWEAGGRRLSSNSFQAVESNTNDGNNIVLISSFADYENSDLFLWQNDNLVASSTSFQTDGSTSIETKFLNIGNTLNTSISNVFEGFIFEIVIYESDQSNHRTSIEQNINDYYNIY